MGSLALEVRSGTKSYSGRAVLRDLDLPVEHGRTLAILGSSGSGKSTLLRVLAGLEELDGGELVNGTPGGGRALTGVVFQRPLLLPWSDVRANVELGLRYRANRGRGDDGAVDRYLRLLGVDALADSLPDQLSGGQAQRVALARALVVRPEVLLLDEPFGALDPVTRGTLQDRLREVAAELELTVVIVTHDVSEAIYLGDRIALLDDSGSVGHWWDGLPGERGTERVGPPRDDILGRYESALPAREVRP